MLRFFISIFGSILIGGLFAGALYQMYPNYQFLRSEYNQTIDGAVIAMVGLGLISVLDSNASFKDGILGLMALAFFGFFTPIVLFGLINFISPEFSISLNEILGPFMSGALSSGFAFGLWWWITSD